MRIDYDTRTASVEITTVNDELLYSIDPTTWVINPRAAGRRTAPFDEGGVATAARDGVDAGAVHLGHVGRVVDTEDGDTDLQRRELWQQVVREQQLHDRGVALLAGEE